MKISIIILIALLLLTGCSSENQIPADASEYIKNTTAASDTSAETVSEVRNVDEHDIPVGDYEGRDFNILYASGGMYVAHERYFFVEQETGNALDTAIYQRNLAVDEYLNININGITKGYIDTIYPEIKRSVLAGDGAYDFALTHTFDGVASMICETLVCDWNNVPYVDLSKNYWNQNLNDTLAINNVLPLASSEYMPADVYLILFNKMIHENYNLPDYYSSVSEGKWTVDMFGNEIKKISSDLDGDGEYTTQDMYGLATLLDANFQAFLNASDMYAVTNTDDGLTVTPVSERLTSLIEKLNGILYGGDYTFTWNYDERENPEKMIDFSSNQALFTIVGINEVENFRAMSTDFGILPLPKYDEAQENYEALSMSGFFVIPKTVGDNELVGKTAELLSYYSAKIFTPVFFDVLLDYKYARDDESQEMLNIIFDNIVYDPAMVLGGCNNISYCMVNILRKPDNDVASFFAKNTSSVQKSYDKVYEGYQKYLEDR